MILLKKIGSVLIAGVFLLLSSCQYFSNNEGEGSLARVGDQYLYLEDIDGIAAETNEDSARIVKNYIDNWIKEQLLLRKALQNLPDDQVNFEKQLERYKRSLIIYAYEKQILRQKLDTLVTDDQIEVYFKNHIESFELKEDILQLRMIISRRSAPNQDSARFWLSSRDSLLLTKLNDYCTGFAEKCVLDTTEWLPLNLLNAYLPQKVQYNSLNEGLNIIEDSLRIVYIDLFSKKAKGSRAPVTYVGDQIRAIIKNQRRLKLLADLRKQILEDASLKNSYEVY